MLISTDGVLVTDFPYATTHQHVVQELGDAGEWLVECIRACIAKSDREPGTGLRSFTADSLRRELANDYNACPLSRLRDAVIRNIGDEECESTFDRYEFFWFGLLLWKCLLDSSETWEYTLNYEPDNECGYSAPFDMKYCER
jgi:hypothetical protein